VRDPAAEGFDSVGGGDDSPECSPSRPNTIFDACFADTGVAWLMLGCDDEDVDDDEAWLMTALGAPAGSSGTAAPSAMSKVRVIRGRVGFSCQYFTLAMSNIRLLARMAGVVWYLSERKITSRIPD